MDKTKWPAISGLIFGTICLSRTIPTTFAFDKPLFSSTALLWSTFLATLVLSRLIDGRRSKTTEHGWTDAELPLEELGLNSNGNVAQPLSAQRAYPLIGRGPWTIDLRRVDRVHILIGAIVLRVEILRNILANTQCTALTWEPLAPLVFACWDYWVVHRHQVRPAYEERPDASIYDAIEQHAIWYKRRYLVTASLISFCSIAAFASSRDPRSTFICAATLHNRWLIPILQRLGTALDAVIAGWIANILFESTNGKARSAADDQKSLPLNVLRKAFLRAAQITTLWSLLLFVIYLIAAAKSQERRRMFQLPGYYIWSLVKLDFSFCFTFICALLSIPHVGILDVTVLTTFVSTCTITTSASLRYFHAFPPTHCNVSLVAAIFLTIAVLAYFYISTAENAVFSNATGGNPDGRTTFKKSVPGWFYLVMVLIIFGRVVIWSNQSRSVVSYHPIDMLIYNAQSEHDAFRAEANSSSTLQGAVQNYRNRYVRYPPPGFDQWYKYATARNAVVIDTFDGIHRDLLPYYAFSPEVIRHRTKQLLQNSWHNTTGISIRDGKAAISTRVVDDHRWMMERLTDMINQFSEYLPDMDLAFNINDECRIAVPWSDLDELRQAGSHVDAVSRPKSAFSPNRASQWESTQGSDEGVKVMTELGWQSTFHSHGAVHCPPGSPARTERHWDRSRLCSTCTSPHSMGAFPANWTQLSDVCHQPDLAELHGFYTSPSAFKTTYELYPVFSQSKAPGFNDILYPSAWNWIEKAKYAPTDEFPDIPFANKNDSIFWRGATSEGMSPDTGQWKGQSRQRFLHILNDINIGGATQILPLPEIHIIPSEAIKGQPPIVEERLRYTPVPISTLTSLVSTDVHFVNRFERCWDIDCPNQANEFGLAAPTNFQEHWQYKYLLDLDGAGFSGRFLPFMFSRSLPFKAALFREWWDDRLTAWQHFVPLDLRAHGVWATLVYFAGLEGKVNGKDAKISPHLNMGERIAENGKVWAEQVLRKDDMEIYFFRLLLEWGRLTDDARDQLGFVGDAVAS